MMKKLLDMKTGTVFDYGAGKLLIKGGRKGLSMNHVYCWDLYDHTQCCVYLFDNKKYRTKPYLSFLIKILNSLSHTSIPLKNKSEGIWV